MYFSFPFCFEFFSIKNCKYLSQQRFLFRHTFLWLLSFSRVCHLYVLGVASDENQTIYSFSIFHILYTQECSTFFHLSFTRLLSTLYNIFIHSCFAEFFFYSFQFPKWIKRREKTENGKISLNLLRRHNLHCSHFILLFSLFFFSCSFVCIDPHSSKSERELAYILSRSDAQLLWCGYSLNFSCQFFVRSISFNYIFLIFSFLKLNCKWMWNDPRANICSDDKKIRWQNTFFERKLSEKRPKKNSKNVIVLLVDGAKWFVAAVRWSKTLIKRIKAI